MSEQNNSSNQPASREKGQMPTLAWIAIIVLVAAIVALVFWGREAKISRTVVLEEKAGASPESSGNTTQTGAGLEVGAKKEEAGTVGGSVQQTVNFDQELKDLDKDANSVSENDFSESDLSDANLGI
jgi:flagellar basal body-associated protein FliL